MALVDAGWAGCGKTWEPTSDSKVKLGRRVLKARGAAQSASATSSGEAEYYGMAKGASELPRRWASCPLAGHGRRADGARRRGLGGGQGERVEERPREGRAR
eukprot:8027512-Alexandrium_andersonii.AAC.1